MKRLIDFFKVKKVELLGSVIFVGAFSSLVAFSRYQDDLMITYKDDLRYDQVCWLTSHNSFAYPGDSFKKQYIPNQDLSIKEQLVYGVRSFMIDLHRKNGKIILAHKPDKIPFYFFEQPILPFFKTIKSWLVDHPKDIITVHLESYIKNHDDIMNIIKEAGLEEYWFDPKHRDSNKIWPTLGEMRKKNKNGKSKRLVIFSDKIEDDLYRYRNKYGYDYRHKRYASKGTLPNFNELGIIHTDIYMETQYNLVQYSNCEMRENGRASKASLFVLNHFYSMMFGASSLSWKIYVNPDGPIFQKLGVVTDFQDINNYQELYRRVCTCVKERGNKLPNFIAMDFIGGNEAEIEIIKEINKLRTEKEIFNWCNKKSDEYYELIDNNNLNVHRGGASANLGPNIPN